MKVKIFTEVGKKIGLGHISRCSSLYDEVIRLGYECEFIIYGEVEGVQLLKNRKITVVNWISEEYLHKNVCSDDYCIVDSYLAGKDILEIISKKAKRVLFIDDMNRIIYPKGIVVNPSLNIGNIKYPKSNEITYLLGSDYIILRNPFVNAEREKVKSVVDRVMITMGGSDFRNITPIIINEICNKYSAIKFDIIISAAFSNITEIKKIANKNVCFHHDVDENTMKDLMMDADFAITTAGQTIYELLITKTPFIPIQVADNQSNNINSLYEFGLIKNAINYFSLSFIDELRESFSQLLHYRLRIDLVSKYRNIIDGKGKERIISKLVNNDKEIMIDFRRISALDCDILYKWANDDLVRKNAFNSEKIEYNIHKKWFYNKLNSNSSYIYIILLNRMPVGQIRIDIENTYGVISYSIDSKYRDKGIGTKAMKLISNRIKKDCTVLKELVGRVKIENISSQRVFEKAGFSKENPSEYFEYRKCL